MNNKLLTELRSFLERIFNSHQDLKLEDNKISKVIFGTYPWLIYRWYYKYNSVISILVLIYKCLLYPNFSKFYIKFKYFLQCGFK